MEKQIKMCLDFVRSSYQVKSLNTYLKADIEEIQQIVDFKYPQQFYEVNPFFKVVYDELNRIDNIKIQKISSEVKCPKCGSDDVSMRIDQFLAGDEVTTQTIYCNFCGGTFNDL